MTFRTKTALKIANFCLKNCALCWNITPSYWLLTEIGSISALLSLTLKPKLGLCFKTATAPRQQHPEIRRVYNWVRRLINCL